MEVAVKAGEKKRGKLQDTQNLSQNGLYSVECDISTPFPASTSPLKLVKHQTLRSLGVSGWTRAPLFVRGVQNQTPTLTKSLLTAERVFWKCPNTALLLLTDERGAEVRSHTADRTTQDKLLSLCPASLQGVLHSSRIDSNIYGFFPCTESLLQTACLIHLHYLILFKFFFLPLYFRKELFPAGIYVHDCWEFMELASYSVHVSNWTRQG